MQIRLFYKAQFACHVAIFIHNKSLHSELKGVKPPNFPSSLNMIKALIYNF